jgi:hypothetical protein
VFGRTAERRAISGTPATSIAAWINVTHFEMFSMPLLCMKFLNGQRPLQKKSIKIDKPLDG